MSNLAGHMRFSAWWTPKDLFMRPGHFVTNYDIIIFDFDHYLEGVVFKPNC